MIQSNHPSDCLPTDSVFVTRAFVIYIAELLMYATSAPSCLNANFSFESSTVKGELSLRTIPKSRVTAIMRIEELENTQNEIIDN